MALEITPVRRTVLMALAIALLLAAAPFVGTYRLYLANVALANIVVAVGLNLLVGNAGQISLCSSSFMALGAYAQAILMTRAGLSFWLALPLGGLLAMAAGCLVAIPAMRLSGFYLALATLGFLELTQTLIEELSDLTGGIRGLPAPRPSLFGVSLSSDLAMYYAELPIVILLVFGVYNIIRSPTGRAFDAIRLSVPAAQSLGISPASVKVAAFGISALYAGLAGGLMAAVVGFIDPVDYGASASLRHIMFIVVGGMGSIVGSVVGAVLLTLLPELLRNVKEYSDLVFAALLLAFLILLPKGIVGIATRTDGLSPAVRAQDRQEPVGAP